MKRMGATIRISLFVRWLQHAARSEQEADRSLDGTERVSQGMMMIHCREQVSIPEGGFYAILLPGLPIGARATSIGITYLRRGKKRVVWNSKDA
jgi:hypothetical protein